MKIYIILLLSFTNVYILILLKLHEQEALASNWRIKKNDLVLFDKVISLYIMYYVLPVPLYIKNIISFLDFDDKNLIHAW